MSVGAKWAAVWVLPLAVATLAMAVMAGDPGGLASRIRGIQFDSYQYLAPRPYEDPRASSGYSVRVLDVDDASLKRFGPWPWPHGVLARLIGELKAAGAAVVVLDLPLATPDPTSPEALARDLPAGSEGDAARKALADLPSPDTALAAALASINAVTGFTLTDTAGGAAPALKAPIGFDGAPATLASVPAFGHAVPALSAFETASTGVGAENLAGDADGKLRAMPLVFRMDGKLVPSLDAEVMRLLNGGVPLSLDARETGLPGLVSRERVARVKAGALSVPVRANGAMEIYFSGPDRARHISAATLDDDALATGSLVKAIVYLSAPGQTVATPLGPQSLAEIHAEAMENILLGTALRPVAGLYGGLTFVLIVAIGMVLLLARQRLIWAGALAVGAIALAQTVTWLLFVNTHTLFDSLGPSLALAASFLAGLAARSIEVMRRRGALRATFSSALPQPVLDEIAKRPALLNLAGQTRQVTCLACGVRGYAVLAESFADDPAGFIRSIGAAMARLTDVARAHGATVDCVTAEGFLAYWNAPLDDSEHAIRACEAANRMTVVLAEINEQLSRERRFDGTAFEPIEIGIGISTGPAIAGGVGDSRCTAYTVTGECTLLAARIRARSAQYGPAVVVSEDTRKAAERGYAFLEVDYIALGPRGEAVKLHAMLGNPLVRASPKFRALATFHEHIFQSLRTQQWEKTRELITQCRKLSGASPKLYELHLARIAYFEKNPPGADWDGAFRTILK
ncbi:MAG: adenylate/guanylate cyclase domain-containing protein [Alphaproteobacteria bacterium]|nr:adenylate/guanylate cyclase domain-containing protein [Alphaproteobacteria bacterium]